MRGDAFDLDRHNIGVHTVDYAPLSAEPGRSQGRELPGEFLVVKRLYQPKARRAGLANDGAPQRVLLGYVMRQLVDRFGRVSGLDDRPHAL